MRKRIKVDGYDAGLEPISHPIWKNRVYSAWKAASKLGVVWTPIENLIEHLQAECGWTRRTTQHVIGAAEEAGFLMEKDLHWRAVQLTHDPAVVLAAKFANHPR
jgi:hypothetical protein